MLIHSNTFIFVLFLFLTAIMKFMGDYPMKGQSEQEVVSIILKVQNAFKMPEIYILLK